MSYQPTQPRKILPPFGKILLAYQEEFVRLKHPVYIYVGKEAKEEAFANKQDGTMCSFVPMGEDPASYRWPIRDQKIIVQDTGGVTLRDLRKTCLALIQHDPRLIILWSEDHFIFKFILPPGRKYNG